MQFIEGQTLAALIADLRHADGRPAQAEAQPTTPHVPGQPAPSAETAPRAAASTERARLGRVHFRRVAEGGVQAAEALDHAHALGIVHRDIKPANLLVDGRGGLWVTDFGLAHIQSDARLTMTGDLVGTLRYMSPEQALAKRVVVDHRTDVYSLGATLYELLTLEPAFTGNDRQELLRQIAFEEPKAPRRVDKAIPAELETVVLKAMEKNPAERYATAKELADDLRRWLADEPIRARPAGLVRRLGKWGRRHPRVMAAVMAALMAAGLVASGGIGWVANDRATRAQRTTDEISTALKESADRQQRGRVPEALAAARRAKGALAGGHADAALRRQVEARVDDLELLTRLVEARLEVATREDNHFDRAPVDRRYREVFREFSLELDNGSADEVGKRIRDTSVALELAALLDDWAMWCRWLGSQDEARWKRLLEVARAADPDAGRTRLRDALAMENPVEAVLRLTSVEEGPTLLPWSLSAVAKYVSDAGAHELAEALLRQALRQRPDDFDINVNLSVLLSDSKTPRHEDAIPFCMVGVALRPQSAGAHHNLGNALRATGHLDEAIVEYRKAIEFEPRYASAHQALGAMLYAKQDLDGAIAEYRKCIELDPKDAFAHNNLGVVLSARGDLDGAIAECRMAIELNPTSALAHTTLGSVLYDKGDASGGVAEYQKASKIDPKYAPAHYGLGNALRAKGDVGGAIAECRKAIELDPKDAKAHGNLGAALRDKGDLDGAIAEYKKAIELDPKLAKAHLNLGGVLYDKKDLDMAIVESKKAIELDPKDAKSHTGLGLALRDKGQLEAAIVEFQKAIELDPKDAAPHSNLGAARYVQGDMDRAIAEHRKAIDLDPKLAFAHGNLGAALGAKGDMDGAIVEYRKAIDLDPKYAYVHNNLGNALRAKGDVDGAIAELREAVALEPRYADAYTNLGVALYDKGDVEGAIAEHRRAIELNPKHVLGHSNLGTALLAKRDVEGAITVLRKAIDLDPNDFTAHHNLGLSLRAKGDVDGAIAEWRRAVELAPGSALTHLPLGDALRAKGQFAEALTHVRRGHELGSKDPRWPYPSAQWVKQYERLVELDGKLPSVLSGKEQPASAAERAEYAEVCYRKRLYAAAARLSREAIAGQPDRAASPVNGLRYNAAFPAALAGCGAGEDAAQLTDAERAGLRKQALDWLRADLDAWRGLLEKQPDRARPVVAQQMQHWLDDRDFNGVRGPDALAKLPEAERKEWEKLWADVAATLAQTQQKPTPAGTKAPPPEGPRND
jgi:tetratricopeptide (TPR) repeat protein